MLDAQHNISILAYVDVSYGIEIHEGADDASSGTLSDESRGNDKRVCNHFDFITSPAFNPNGHSDNMHLAYDLLAQVSKIRA